MTNTNDIATLTVILVGVMLLGISIFEQITHDIRMQLEEERYMQEHYGYRDNMSEYLEYLKINDFDAYMKLKPIYDDIHPNSYWFILIFVSVIVLMLSLFITDRI